jgi:hypothetical protein
MLRPIAPLVQMPSNIREPTAVSNLVWFDDSTSVAIGTTRGSMAAAIDGSPVAARTPETLVTDLSKSAGTRENLRPAFRRWLTCRTTMAHSAHM